MHTLPIRHLNPYGFIKPFVHWAGLCHLATLLGRTLAPLRWTLASWPPPGSGSGTLARLLLAISAANILSKGIVIVLIPSVVVILIPAPASATAHGSCLYCLTSALRLRL